jgi:hypothetical protein
VRESVVGRGVVQARATCEAVVQKRSILTTVSWTYRLATFADADAITVLSMSTAQMPLEPSDDATVLT